MKALIAEDNDLYRDVLELALMEAGYKVTVTINGADALKMLEENTAESFDLIVTDYEMPLMSGRQLIQSIIKKNISFKKIVLLSGSVEATELTREFIQHRPKIHVVTKDTPISHLRQNLFKI